MPPDPGSVISRAPGAVFRQLSAGQGAVILNLDSGQYHGVNEIGKLVWELLDRSPTFPALVDAVRARVTDAPSELAGDIASFLEALTERGLVTIASAAGSAG